MSSFRTVFLCVFLIVFTLLGLMSGAEAQTIFDEILGNRAPPVARPTVFLPQGPIEAMVRASARLYAVPEGLAIAVARVEGMSCHKVGRVGERGPMQVRPQTARGMGLYPRTCGDWINAGMRYLKMAIAMHGAGCGGATAYNMGTYTRGSYCSGYGRTVMALAHGGMPRWHSRKRHHRK